MLLSDVYQPVGLVLVQQQSSRHECGRHSRGFDSGLWLGSEEVRTDRTGRRPGIIAPERRTSVLKTLISRYHFRSNSTVLTSAFVLGVPILEDIRLGDVVVSQPNHVFGGVVQYDSGKATLSGFQRTGSLDSPPEILLNAIARVQANHYRGSSRLSEYVAKLGSSPMFQRSKTGPDILFQASYEHKGGQTCELTPEDVTLLHSGAQVTQL